MKLTDKDKFIIMRALNCYNDTLFHATTIVEGEQREKVMQYQADVNLLWERFLEPDKGKRNDKSAKPSGTVKCQLCGKEFYPGIPTWTIGEDTVISKPKRVICDDCLKKVLPNVIVDDGTLPY